MIPKRSQSAGGLWLAVLAAAMLAGCGLKGDLYLPEEATVESDNPAAGEASAEEDSASEDREIEFGTAAQETAEQFGEPRNPENSENSESQEDSEQNGAN